MADVALRFLPATCAECSELVTPTQKRERAAKLQALQAQQHKMLANPIRTRILMVLGDREASPKELAELLDEDFQRVCQQVRVLRRHEFIELVAEDKRKGGTQHFYKATNRSHLDADQWEQIPRIDRETNSADILRVTVEDFRQALATGDFDAHRHRVLVRKPMMVDEQGMKEADESAIRHLEELERIEAASATRRIESGERAIPIKAVVVIHPSARSGLPTRQS